MVDVEKVLAQVEKDCRRTGRRLTEKRKQVLIGLLKSERALSAYEIVNYCKWTYQTSFAPMTVYRILEFLESEKLVHKLHITNKYVACSNICCKQEHDVAQFLICDSCGSVKEVSVDGSALETLKNNAEHVGFQVKSPQIELHGLCQNCCSKEQAH
ncbi:Fur family transcriptional regulator [Pseudoteredinibacter isoporae]|uniref:Fur family zinc uptake transcriptional regulator n=1 Tax=Pseudoteredinibacter isoporae TaxID=570281 RepID=A0A7X0MVZ2_9GAMM|nr:Fur family transcriptional regulator [Pseudoteredinibacter isoporae]MBB6522241.1 Fur family zinc uptake transcriptional regulator [Pseudoteredinibacter isoporae]NHO87775.1 transcriptional repressor [Pseudoteredinibacter isoporae]NIB23894.1 transcriptional repressor [Pseudoteredinibacter isoporae]